MPRLRDEFSPELVAQVRALRAKGRRLQQIAKQLDVSVSWAGRVSQDVPLPVRPPVDPVLALRVRNLLKRGFDVPPSRQEEYRLLARKGYTAEERRQIMKLE